jgi:hypothetical protein
LFQPVQATHAFDYRDPQQLTFGGQDLLALTSLRDGTAATIDPATVRLLGDRASGPFWGLALTSGSLRYSTSRLRAIEVSGVWGSHPAYEEAWYLAGVTLTSALDATTATIPVANGATDLDSLGGSPRFSAGALIALESEWMQVLATTATQITVLRGANGTTAAAHAVGVPFRIYAPPADIAEACARWAAWSAAQDDADLGRSELATVGGRDLPAGLPADLVGLLDYYAVTLLG